MAKRVVRENKNSYVVQVKANDTLDKPKIIRRNGKRFAALVPIQDYERYAAWSRNQPRSGMVAKKRPAARKATTWLEKQKKLLAREVAAYNEMKAELMGASKNKWVAILNGKLVDKADDE